MTKSKKLTTKKPATKKTEANSMVNIHLVNNNKIVDDSKYTNNITNFVEMDFFVSMDIQFIMQAEVTEINILAKYERKDLGRGDDMFIQRQEDFSLGNHWL